jgi:hypothetical protein
MTTEEHEGDGRDGGRRRPSFGRMQIRATVTCTGRTGVEMEAMSAVMGAALTVYDMCKAVDKGMVIGNARVVEKMGGKSGHWVDGRNVGEGSYHNKTKEKMRRNHSPVEEEVVVVEEAKELIDDNLDDTIFDDHDAGSTTPVPPMEIRIDQSEGKMMQRGRPDGSDDARPQQKE